MQTTLEDRYAIAMQEALKCLRNPIDGENESDIVNHLMTTTGLTRDDSVEVVRRAVEKINPVAVPVQQDVIKLDSPVEVESVLPSQNEQTVQLPAMPFFQRIAIPLAQRGLKVMPIKGKVAFLPNHQREATSDVQRIAKQFAPYSGCNVGVMCIQEPGGAIIVDVDGEDVRSLYERETGKQAPQTYTVQSSPNKYHIYFFQTDKTLELPGNIPESKTNGEFSLRLKNYYVVGENSIHPNHGGVYTAVSTAPIVSMPDDFLEWLLSRVQETKGKKASAATGVDPTLLDDRVRLEKFIEDAIAGDPIPHGQHDSTLASIAGRLRHHGLNREQMTGALIRACEMRCVNYGSDYQQMCEKIARSYERYEPGQDSRVLVNGHFAGTAGNYGRPDVQQLQGQIDESDDQSWQDRVNNWLAEGVGQAEIGERFLKEVGATVQKAMVAKQLADDAEEAERLNAPWDKPTELQPALSAVQPFDESFLPVAIRGWVKDVSYRLGVPMDFPGICAICTLAGVIGRRAFVHPKERDKEWRESIALSGAVVAHSGATKSPVWKHFTSVLSEIDLSRQEVYKQQAANFESSLVSWEKQLADFQRDKKTPHPAFINGKPVEPEGAKRCLVNDATPEKLQDILSDNPEGVLYYRDELSGWVAEFQKEGREAQRGLFLAAMNGDDTFTLDRIERGSTTAKMCCSVFGSFQPHLLIDFLNQDGGVNIANGMIPRFSLLVYPDVQQGVVYTDYPADKLAKDNFQRICKRLAELPEDSINLHFQKDAQEVYKRFWEETKQKSESDPDAGVRSHLSKYLGVLPKIAALFQIVDLVCQNGPVQGRQTIDLEHLEQAIQLMRYLEGHMHRLYGCIKTEVEQAELALSEHVRSGDLSDGFTLRDIKRKHWTGLGNSEWNDYALETLEELNWLRRFEKKPGKQGGRPSNYWLINPAILAGWQAARRAGKRT